MKISDLVAAIITGVFSSFAIWWVLYRHVVPKIEFASKIVKYFNSKGQEEFKIRIKNSNQYRKIIDGKILCRVYVENFENGNKEAMLKVFNFDFKQSRFPYIKKDSGKYNVWEHPFKTLILNEPSSSAVNLRDGETNHGFSLETILEKYPNAKIKFIVFAHDSFTGTKKMIESKYYDKNSIVRGTYRQFSLDVITMESEAKNKV